MLFVSPSSFFVFFINPTSLRCLSSNFPSLVARFAFSWAMLLCHSLCQKRLKGIGRLKKNLSREKKKYQGQSRSKVEEKQKANRREAEGEQMGSQRDDDGKLKGSQREAEGEPKGS